MALLFEAGQRLIVNPKPIVEAGADDVGGDVEGDGTAAAGDVAAKIADRQQPVILR
jgi:hypothetical protein